MKPIKKPEDVWSKFALSIFKINGLLIWAGEAISSPIGQSSARWQILGRVYVPQTVTQLAREIGHARQSVQRVADALEKDGLIAYQPHPTDRRTQLLVLTPRGREVLSAIYKRQLEWSHRVLTVLDPDQLLQIAVALEAVGETLEAKLKKEDGD